MYTNSDEVRWRQKILNDSRAKITILEVEQARDRAKLKFLKKSSDEYMVVRGRMMKRRSGVDGLRSLNKIIRKIYRWFSQNHAYPW